MRTVKIKLANKSVSKGKNSPIFLSFICISPQRRKYIAPQIEIGRQKVGTKSESIATTPMAILEKPISLTSFEALSSSIPKIDLRVKFGAIICFNPAERSLNPIIEKQLHLRQRKNEMGDLTAKISISIEDIGTIRKNSITEISYRPIFRLKSSI